MQQKLVFFIASLSSGGAERVVSILSGKMLDYFREVEIITFMNYPVFYNIDSRVKVLSIEKSTGSKSVLKNCLYLRKYLSNNEPTVLLSFLAPFNILALLSVPCFRNYPVIVADRNDPRFECRNTIRKILRHILYKYKADRVIVQTVNNQKYYPKRVQKKMDVIYNPISICEDLFGCAINTPKKKQLVNVARLDEQKNQRMLLRSFKRVLYKYPDYCLTIYGEGPMREELMDYVKELGLERSVLLPGRESNIIEKMKSAEIFVLSSNYEGMSNSMLEALCIGLPVVSTEVSGAVDLIKSGENGILVPINDEDKLTKALLTVIESKSLRETLSINAIKVSELLKVDTITKKWVNCIEKTLRFKNVR